MKTADKKKYYTLDDIGFIGTQRKISKAQHDKEMKQVSEYIQKHKEKQIKKAA